MKKLIILLTLCSLIIAQTTLNYKEKYHDPVHAKIMEIRQQNIDTENKTPSTIITWPAFIPCRTMWTNR